LRVAGGRSCSDVLELANAKMTEVDARIADLRRVRGALARLADRPWLRECKVLHYRGAWQEWAPHEIDLAVPISPDEVEELRAHHYNPFDYYHRDPELKALVDWLGSDSFAPPGALHPLRHSLLEGGDPFLVLADFRAYIEAQEQVDAAYKDTGRWAQMAILNTLRVGTVASDRTINEYAREIWNLKGCPGEG